MQSSDYQKYLDKCKESGREPMYKTEKEYIEFNRRFEEISEEKQREIEKEEAELEAQREAPFIIGGKIDALALKNFFYQRYIFRFVEDIETGYKRMYLFNPKDGIYIPCSKTQLQNKLINLIENLREKYDLALSNYIQSVKYAADYIYASEKFSIDFDEFNSRENIIILENGVLNLDDMKLSEKEAKKASEYLSTIKLPFEWIEGEPETPIFDKYQNDMFRDDEAAKKLVCQYIGAILSNVEGPRYKSALFLIGAGDTGKSVLFSFIERALGKENCFMTTLQNLEGKYDAVNLKGKRFAGDSDMRIDYIPNIEMFKKLTGEPGAYIRGEQKGEPVINFRFKGLTMYAGNDMPRFGGDRGKHVYDRMIILPCKNSIAKDKQDARLNEKLLSERNAIFKKCILAFNETRKNHRFDIPEISKAALKQYKKDNSPVSAFLEECCELPMPGDSCNNFDRRISIIYKVYRQYCEDNGIKKPVSNKEFRKEAETYYNKNKITTFSEGIERALFKLKYEALREYGGLIASERLNKEDARGNV